MSTKFRHTMLAVGLLAAAPMAGTAMAEPGGCLKYGAVGAVGGHMAHHGVLGAAGGCATGMVRRHEYRKGLREKAALWDKEHPADPNQSWLERHRNEKTYQQKATLWDAEHPSNATNSPTGTNAGAPATPPQK
ncbi:hypothetical protein [Kozakia baliensis]|uniref:Uncharacterized protein n=1 Tax=Kozakia baliensis TaxID=153496 RepID=A0A1D8UQ85_9PROT|nr:hypothetical protein A0U89_00175 [Kozakia baliensis]GEL64586.1 hypothetical protein KBA01_18720 [Kozakia baliensis]